MSRYFLGQSHRRSNKKSLSKGRPLRLEPLEPRIVLNGGAVVEASVPDASYASSDTSISMTARQDSGLEYYSHNDMIAGHDSGWLNDVTYVDENLTSTEAEQVQYLANQIRAIETFSNPDNPGQIIGQLKKDGYPNPEAENKKDCEKSGTNGLGAYPGDLRNTPGAFQVDLANMCEDKNNPAIEMFGDWKGTAGTLKYASPYDTQFAFSKATLSEFFGIEVDKGGLITKIGAPAASVFLHDDALATVSANAWNPVDNPLVGFHIDNFQSEQLSLYLAGRDPKDYGTGVTDPRTSPPEVMDLAKALQDQVSKSFMWAVYNKFLNHETYKGTFEQIELLYGATLKITSSQAQTIFGVNEGDEFWCRLTPGFVLGGTYVRGEVEMFNLSKALVQANNEGTGTWTVEGKAITFTRVTPAGTAAKQAVFTVDRTPPNMGYPTILHYAAVVSPFGTTDYTADPVTFDVHMIDMTNEAAWGYKDRKPPLGYDRMPDATTVSGSQTLTEGGSYIYEDLGAGGTLTLSGAGTFVVNKPAEGPTITSNGYPKDGNNCQHVFAGQKTDPWVGQEIDISDFFTKGILENNKDVLNSSFYSWWQDGIRKVVAVGDVTGSTIPEATRVELYFTPCVKDEPDAAAKVREAIESYTVFWDETSPWYHSALLKAVDVNVLKWSNNADEWAKRFITTPPKPGTGVIDASLATGKVLIVIDNTIKEVKLGSGCTTVLASQKNTGPKTFVFNPSATTSPTIALRSDDVIDWSGFTPQLDWDGGDPKTFDNKIDIERMTPPYLRYSYFDCWSGKQGSQTEATFQAIVRANANTGAGDPTEIVKNALNPPMVTINQASRQADQTSASLMNFTVVFSEAMSDFDGNEVTVVGPAETVDGASVVVTNPSGDKVNYSVAVTLVDTACEGAVSTSIAAGEVHDEGGFTNLASTSTHNNVAYKPNTITGEIDSNDDSNQALAAANNDGEPLPGVHVLLKSQAPTGFAERTTTTDSYGCYQFENVPDGTYQVVVTHPTACLPGGSDTTVVSVEGSQSYQVDFQEGALRPNCIPNRMMATSSLPVGSTQWRQVVQEALNLGEKAGSQAAQLGDAGTSQPAAVQYLVLGPRAASAVADTPVLNAGDAVSVNTADVQAAGVPVQVAQAAVAPIVQEAVTPIVQEAITRWTAAGLDQQTLSKMQNTTFVLSDLAGLNLGMTTGNTVWIDRDAAGRGWFVDSTPNDDKEFTSAAAGGQLRAVDPRAVDRIDMLSVVSHELGHVAGRKDSDINTLGLMNPSLETGLRVVPSTHDAALMGV